MRIGTFDYSLMSSPSSIIGKKDDDRSSSTDITDKIGSGSSAQEIVKSAREKIDKDYEKAKAEGKEIVFDKSKEGRHLDLKSLSFDELASVAVGKGFSENEVATAKEELSTRMTAVLAPFQNSPRDTALAVKALYPALSQNARLALGWNEESLMKADSVISGNRNSAMSSYELQSVMSKLVDSQSNRSSAIFNAALLGERRTSFSSQA